MMVGVMHPETIGIDEKGVGRIWANQGKGAPKRSMESGNKATVSISAVFPITSVGEVMRSPVTSSLMIEGYVGR